MAKYRFTRNHGTHKKGEVVEGMQFDTNTVMIKQQFGTGHICHFAPIALGTQKVLTRLK